MKIFRHSKDLRSQMHKILFIISLIMSTTSTFALTSEDRSKENNDAQVIESVPPTNLSFEVSLKMENFNREQEEKVLKAADLIKKIVVTDEFKNGVLHHTYKGKKTFADNNGLTNEQIYKRILEGSEELRPGTDNKMDLELEVYFEETRTVGYTRPSVFKIWMNSKYLNKNGPAEVTTNMMHEWLHKLGFKHELKHSERRMNTVPYAIGYLMEKLARKMYLDGTL